MEEMQNPSIIEAIQAPAQQYGIKRLAGELNKAPSTVYSELNPWGDRSKAKLGLEDALEIMRLTGDYTALHLAADQHGFKLIAKSGFTPDAPTMFEEFTQDHKALVEFHEEGVKFRQGESTRKRVLAKKEAAHVDINESYERILSGDEPCEGHIYRPGENRPIKVEVAQ